MRIKLLSPIQRLLKWLSTAAWIVANVQAIIFFLVLSFCGALAAGAYWVLLA